jgi:hypothetical protein
VAAGLIVVDALAEPDELRDAEIVAQQHLDFAALQARVAVGVEHALLGEERGALAVDVQRAAFDDERRAITLEALDLEHLTCHLLILIPGKVQPVRESAPGVEVPVDAAHRALRAGDARGSHVAHPGVVVRHLDEAHPRRQQRARGAIVRRRHADRYRLEAGDGACYLRKGELGGTRGIAPVVGPLRPQQPAARVRRELRRHRKAVRGGRTGERAGHCRRRLLRNP